MTLKPDIDILKTYLQTEKVIALISTKIALKVKRQGQMSLTSNHL